MRRLLLAVMCVGLLGCTPAAPPSPTPRADNVDEVSPAELLPVSPDLAARAERVDDLSAYADGGDTGPSVAPAPRSRAALLGEQRRLRSAGDAAALARLNAILASEAFARSAAVATRWLDRRDARTGLFPKHFGPDGRLWTYGDVGSDLYPFLGIVSALLLPDRYPEVLATLAAERAASPGFPSDFWLDDGRPFETDEEKRLLGAVEYAKDGLLPLVEMLGRDPWLPRLREVTDQALAAVRTPTGRGPIPAHSTEINGSALQVLARLWWMTGEPRYLEMGDRISAAYLEDALPRTEHLPVHRWDFVDNEPIGPRRFFLGDHGNEIVSGLVEWHRVKLAVGDATAARQRAALRKLLDRLTSKGRAPNGLWHERIDVPSGRVRDRDLTDNWGYLAQAYLNQADVERSAPAGRTPSGDPELAKRYEAVATTALAGAAGVVHYPWQAGEMDGYADTLEGALYLLRYLDSPEAADWVGGQMAVLYGFQGPDGRVTDDNIDGNFIRTAMLYGLSLTGGARLDPWSDGVSIGAARDGACLELHLQAESPWTGRLVFDAERHRVNLGLPADYPRLNQWPEWFAVAADRRYVLGDGTGQDTVYGGAQLAAGVPINLEPDRAHRFRACPAA